jgi:hypothetical protein
MIKFFRHIRKKMIKENKFSKYLLYSIGEIILVVIGILIALQINNNNEVKKQTIELHGYLKNISKNIQKDSIDTYKMKAFRDSVSVYTYKTIFFTKQDSVSISDFEYLIHPTYNVFFDNYLQINQSGYEALKNSRYIGKLQGSNLEDFLIEYYTLVGAIAAQEKSMNDFIENMEVMGFESEAFLFLSDMYVFQANRKDFPIFIKENASKIITTFKDKAILSANYRGFIVGNLKAQYQELIALGNPIQKEIKTTINE